MSAPTTTPASAQDVETTSFAFSHHSRSWWYDAIKNTPAYADLVDEISVMKQDSKGTLWEFTIQWRRVPSAMKVSVFDEAFSAFSELPDLFAALAQGDLDSPADVCALLVNLGIADVTQTVKPDDSAR